MCMDIIGYPLMMDMDWIIHGSLKLSMEHGNRGISTEHGQKMMDIHGLSMLSGYPNDSIENT